MKRITNHNTATPNASSQSQQIVPLSSVELAECFGGEDIILQIIIEDHTLI
ncbi:MAG: hypothetical protein AAFU03_17515 [Bacteroidota bacterium]